MGFQHVVATQKPFSIQLGLYSHQLLHELIYKLDLCPESTTKPFLETFYDGLIFSAIFLDNPIFNINCAVPQRDNVPDHCYQRKKKKIARLPCN